MFLKISFRTQIARHRQTPQFQYATDTSQANDTECFQKENEKKPEDAKENTKNNGENETKPTKLNP